MPYGALLEIGPTEASSGGTILSVSPELFFERRGDTLRAKPMKGTAPRVV